ncbi:SPASM domain-containing protein [Streptomyces sp. NPDC056713]|uniref:SPASM domain-containing protein n=1 Tax=Streptomyces sp. NPDC056713 TaxID=3345921 RepID=UPI00369E21A4
MEGFRNLCDESARSPAFRQEARHGSIGVVDPRLPATDPKCGVRTRAAVIDVNQDAESAERTVKFLTDLGVSGSTRSSEVREFGRAKELLGQESSLSGLCGYCWSGKLAVAPDGKVFTCVMARDWPVGDVPSQSLGEILHGGELARIRREIHETVWLPATADKERCPQTCGPDLACPCDPPALSQVLRPHAPEVTDMARSEDEPQSNPVPPYGPPVHDAIGHQQERVKAVAEAARKALYGVVFTPPSGAVRRGEGLAASVPSAAPYPCSPTRPASSPSTPPPAPAIHGPARSSPRHGALATSSTQPWSAPTSSRRSAPTPPLPAESRVRVRAGDSARRECALVIPGQRRPVARMTRNCPPPAAVRNDDPPPAPSTRS